MRQVVFILAIVCVMPFSLLSQRYFENYCDTEDLPPQQPIISVHSMSDFSKYNAFSYYIPYIYEAKALKIVNVNFIIVQDDDGRYNFQENNQLDMNALSSAEFNLNEMYKQIQYPSDPCPGVEYIQNSMIQFHINRIFIRSSHALDLFQSKTTWNDTKNYLVVNNYVPDYKKAFNVFFFENKCAINAINENIDKFPMYDGTNYAYLHQLRLFYLNQAGCGGIAAGGSANYPSSTLSDDFFSYVNEANRYYFHHFDVITNNMGDVDYRAVYCARNIGHELGHSFHLDHTHSPDDIDDTPYPDSSPSFCNPYQNNEDGYDPCNGWCDGCTNNMMGYSDYTLYLSPLQLGKIHRSFSLTSNYNKLYNKPFSEVSIEITSNETWDFDYRIFSNIVIKVWSYTNH